MSNSEYREAQQQAREHGLKARHEQRLENATYTAAEVKVLTEAALRLGRKEALGEAAAKADWLAEGVANPQKPYNEAFIHACGVVARHIRELASQPLQDVSSARTDLSVDTDLPQGTQAVREAQ